MYLSTPEWGGETIFPAAEFKSDPNDNTLSACARDALANKPYKGDALLFYSLTPDGKEDQRSVHGSCPTIKGCARRRRGERAGLGRRAEWEERQQRRAAAARSAPSLAPPRPEVTAHTAPPNPNPTTPKPPSLPPPVRSGAPPSGSTSGHTAAARSSRCGPGRKRATPAARVREKALASPFTRRWLPAHARERARARHPQTPPAPKPARRSSSGATASTATRCAPAGPSAASAPPTRPTCWPTAR
jgi:hypothetical protein